MTAQPYTPAEEAAIRAWLDADEGRFSGRDELRRAFATLDRERGAEPRPTPHEARYRVHDDEGNHVADHPVTAARPPGAEAGLRERIIRAVAKIDGYDNPNTEPGGWWDKRCAPVVAAAAHLPSMPPASTGAFIEGSANDAKR